MPFIEKSSYKRAPRLQFNGHLQTILPSLARRLPPTPYQRERLELVDGDFLDLDWLKNGQKRLVILTHGLEGNSSRSYILGMAKIFSENNWDVLAWNCRSCSGEMNRAFRMYHHGEIEDIGTIVDYGVLLGYEHIALVGFSMGGNINMKYAGVHGDRLPKAVKALVSFSAPFDLRAGAQVLNRLDNKVYKKRFLKALSHKIRIKDAAFPGRVDVQLLEKVRTWEDFDEWFSAPICGYKNAEEFYEKASAKNFAGGVRIPALLVNAQNDPILTPACMPIALAQNHAYFHFEMPAHGGHCGFAQPGEVHTWAEVRALEFISQYV